MDTEFSRKLKDKFSSIFEKAHDKQHVNEKQNVQLKSELTVEEHSLDVENNESPTRRDKIGTRKIAILSDVQVCKPQVYRNGAAPSDNCVFGSPVTTQNDTDEDVPVQNNKFYNSETYEEVGYSQECSSNDTAIMETSDPAVSYADVIHSGSRKTGKQQTPNTIKMMNSLFGSIKRRNLKQNEDSLFLVDYSSVDKLQPDKGKKRGRGRRKKIEVVDVDQPNDQQGAVTCAVCHLGMSIKQWPYHKQSIHNNLAWRVGDEPLDLNDQTFVMRTLSLLYKSKKPLHCDRCGEKKKSVLGFLSHQTVCRKSQNEIEAMKVVCELCSNSMLPVSLASHMKLCHSGSPPKKKSRAAEVIIGGKRSAAKKAQNLINSITRVDNEQTLESISLCNYNFVADDAFLRDVYEHEILENGIAKCRFETCEYGSEEIQTLLEHVASCDRKSSNNWYACRTCLSTYDSSENLLQHFNASHAVLDVEVKEEHLLSDEPIVKNEYKKVRKPATSIKQVSFYSNYPKFLWEYRKGKTRNVVYPAAYGWTLKFHEDNFSNQNLFEDIKVYAHNWPQICPSALLKYSPELSHSLSFAIKNVKGYVNAVTDEYEWMHLGLFESTVSKSGNVTLFCGGSISALSWAPTPFTTENVEQILAIGVTLHMDRKFRVNREYDDSGLIQFWNFGGLQNGVVSIEKPSLAFCICHDYGYVYHLEWCPSGCYDLEKAVEERSMWRMGLLAVATSDSFVYVYAVPVPSELRLKKLLKPKPQLKLCLQKQLDESQKLGKATFHATKLSWTKAGGHRYLAVGYSNGMVGVFNLHAQSQLLMTQNSSDGMINLFPFRVFQAHTHAVTVLQLFHLKGGCRWLLTGSVDRSSKVWDLDEVSVPISRVKKFVFTDGVWLNYWLCSILGFDETTCVGRAPTHAYQIRNYLNVPTTLLHSGATVMCLSGNEWVNGIIQASSAGEILGSFPHQLFVGTDNDKSIRTKKFLFSYAVAIEKNLDPEEREDVRQKKDEALRNKLTKFKSIKELEECDSYVEMPEDPNLDPLDKLNPHYCCYEPLSYDEAINQYGLVFCDVNTGWSDAAHKVVIEDMSAVSEKQPMQQPNMYPLTAANKIAFNPNKQAFLYYACGYQVGLVRLFCLRFLDT